MRFRLTMIAAAALLGSFGAAGFVNGLWATPDARAHSVEGLKAALGLPYGNARSTHRFQMHTSSVILPNLQVAQKEYETPRPHRQGLMAQLFQKPVVQTTRHMVRVDVATGFEVPEPPEPPEAPSAPEAPAPPAVTAKLSAPMPTSIQRLLAQAESDANRSAKAALKAAAYASAAERAYGNLQVRVEVPMVVTFAEYQGLERELDLAIAQLDAIQALAIQVNEGDMAFAVGAAHGKSPCKGDQINDECTSLNPELSSKLSRGDIGRMRSDIAVQLGRAHKAVRKSQLKLARARLTDG